MFRNQYLVASTPLTPPPALRTAQFGSLHVCAHPSLPVESATGPSAELLLLGSLLDPLNPEHSSRRILQQLANTVNTRQALFKHVQLLSGRFVILYRGGEDMIAMGDTCGLRQLYYGWESGGVILTSSPMMFLKLFHLEPSISTAKKSFMSMPEYVHNECAWIGDEGMDDRLHKVLPNHFLDLTAREVRRIPPATDQLISGNEIREYAAEMLRGSLQAIHTRHDVVQPLTAGWDSRMLLAAAKTLKDRTSFYIFDHSHSQREPLDVVVARKLASGLGLRFQVVQTEPLRDDFLTAYREEHLRPRVVEATEDVQHHYLHVRDQDTVRVSGCGGELVRCHYGSSRREVTPAMLRYFFIGSARSRYANEAIDRWYGNARAYGKDFGIPLSDLFYWEQRMGNWGSMYSAEQDIALEEFCPFSNRNLILSVMAVAPRRRRLPRCSFIRELVEALWPEALTEPVNPTHPIGYARMMAGGHSTCKYYRLRAREVLRGLHT